MRNLVLSARGSKWFDDREYNDGDKGQYRQLIKNTVKAMCMRIGIPGKKFQIAAAHMVVADQQGD